MTTARFAHALISTEGLTVSWADVPAPGEHAELLLSVIAGRTDGASVRFGTRWVRGAEDSPIVFVWDSASVQEKHHEDAESAITREGGTVDVLFPRAWVDVLLDADRVPAEAVVTVDGADVSAVELELDKR